MKPKEKEVVANFKATSEGVTITGIGETRDEAIKRFDDNLNAKLGRQTSVDYARRLADAVQVTAVNPDKGNH